MRYEDLKGKRVLVTGSSGGIGSATAIMFAQQGSFVGVHYFHTRYAGEETLKKVREYSSGVLLKADVRDVEQVDRMVAEFAKKAGGIDILVNNAGSMIHRENFETATAEYHDNVYATNVKSVFLVTKAALSYLRKSSGCIVNVGSLAGHTGGGGGSGMYAGAKAAVAAETISMAREFAKYGIRVNTVMPGVVETRFHERFSTPERLEKIARRTPLGRNAVGDDVAKAILFLASCEASGFITGEYIAVNGGLYMRA